MFITPAYAQAAGGAAVNPVISNLMLFLPLFLIIYFLIWRPQQQKLKDQQKLIAALRRGDQIVTAGGIRAKVTKVIDDKDIEVEIADGVKVRVLKNTISHVVSKTEPASGAN